MDTRISEKMLNDLPQGLQLAQKAIETEEVQEIIKQLAKYNLGVCMPHMHTEGNGFAELPKDMMQIEQKLRTSFVPVAEVNPETMIPVVWRHVDGLTVSASSCHTCE